MQVIKIILVLAATVSTLFLSFYLIRLLKKAGLGLSHVNSTLEDARPQINLLLVNLNHTLEEVNGELEKVEYLTGQAREMIFRIERSIGSLEKAFNSPLAIYGSMLVGMYSTSYLVRAVLRRGERRAERVKRMMPHS
jgi:hypothetical protein